MGRIVANAAYASRAASFDAFRCAIASTVTIGLTPEALLNDEASITYSPGTSHVSPSHVHAVSAGEPPTRAEPIRWKAKKTQRPGAKPSAVHAACHRSRAPRAGAYESPRAWLERISRAPAASRIRAAPSRPTRTCAAS